MKIPLITFAPAFLSLFIASQANGEVPADSNPLDFPGQGPVGPAPGGPGGVPLIPIIPPVIIGPTGNEYEIINLGSGLSYGINDRGQVVGRSGSHATLFSGTGTWNIDLGTLSGTSSTAYDINNVGQIVGSARNAVGEDRATIFSGSGLGNIDVGQGKISSINNFGQNVGTSNGRATFFSSDGASNYDLGTLGGLFSSATAINDQGTIVGSAFLAGNATSHATRFNLISGLGNYDLGTLGGPSSEANDINNLGTIIGRATTSGSSDPVATQFTDTGSNNNSLGTLGESQSNAMGINERGQIVGSAFTPSPLTTSDFIVVEGSPVELTSLAATSATAQGISEIQIINRGTINNWGQIAAIGTVAGQGTRALLLNPTTPISTIGQNPGAEYLPVGGTRLVAGMAYSKVTSLTTLSTDPGEGVQASLFGGTAGNGGTGEYGLNRNVTLSFTTGDAASYGNIISLTGTENDTLTIQLTYEEAELIALFGSENAALGWLNDSGVWVNAVAGNFGGTATFVDGAWSSAYPLGTYGINRDANSVWAVINHNSSFAVIQGVPEPSAFLLSVLGSLALFRRRVRS